MHVSRMLSKTVSSPFISPHVLVKSKRVPIDATWFMPNVARSSHAEYLSKRIPHARFFDVDGITDPTSPFPHMLPTPAHFSQKLSQMGIKKSDDLCIYDVQGLFSAARVYWTFSVFNHVGDVKILEGGLPAYERAGLPLEHGPLKEFEKVDYGHVEINHDKVVQFEEVLRIAKREGDHAETQLLDARPNARFTGKAREPRAGLESGHAPNSLSLPFSELVTSQGTVLREDELRALLDKKGVDLSKPIVASCGSGVTACVIAVALETIGVQARIYDESWTGYADASRAGNLPGMIVKG